MAEIIKLPCNYNHPSLLPPKKTKNKISWGTSAKNGPAEIGQGRWYSEGYHLIARESIVYRRWFVDGQYRSEPIAQIRYEECLLIPYPHIESLGEWYVLEDRCKHLLGFDQYRDSNAAHRRIEYLETSYALNDRGKKAYRKLRSSNRSDKRSRQAKKDAIKLY